MSVKTVTVNITSHPLSREENGVTFNVKKGNAKFGELVVSKGGIRWKPKNKQDHHHIDWNALDKIALDYPRR
ncbi:MAG TPA: hypothetical protein VNE63_21120 [Candidatus Acidoferrales bacterium]|nr:hypothetical protein [Candidatus Acidoferrales bacterium]